MGRPVERNHKPLLEDEDQNIGNSATLLPQSGSFGTVIPQLNPTRLLNLSAGSSRGQTTSVVVTASRIIGNQNPYPGLPGPVTGIVEFGNGGRFTKAEFDVPVGPFVGPLNQPVSAIEPQDGGTTITVPTGIVRLYARYDNLLISPVLDSASPPRSLAQLLGAAFYGPGGPSGAPPDPAEPLLTKAMASYFSRHRAKVYKTNYLYVANISAPAAINVNTRQFFALPAFAKTVKVLRMPINTAIDIVLHNGVHTVDQLAIPAGTTCPEIDVVGHECIIGLQSPLPADSYILLAICCEIGI